MKLTGYNFIGSTLSGIGKEVFRAVNPAMDSELDPVFHDAVISEIDEAIVKASAVFLNYGKKTGKERAVFLEAIAEEILSLGDELIQRCCEETGLPTARIVGERGRTIHQLRLFAELLKEGSWVDARIDTADPNRQPIPKPDIRCMQKALGPVGIFGASNFPLAFSVAGGDTVSALAAGCPVIFKAHPAHPGTCEMIASAIISAVTQCGMPDGTFSMVHGNSTDVGMAIVKHPWIKAIGFTGSFNGGKAIYDATVRRSEPIPVYAEMGSSNPVFILPEALQQKGDEIAKGLTASITIGAGQFCTNPGLVILEESQHLIQFQNNMKDYIEGTASASMLSKSIQQKYNTAVEKRAEGNGVELLAQGKTEGTGFQGTASVLKTSVEKYLQNDDLQEEIFGPSSLEVIARTKEDLLKAARSLRGHLTATIWATEKELHNYADLIAILEQKVGRLIINGFPTGVEVCHSMVHGGPYPATTDSRSTSVGTMAITRFTRPVSFQNFPNVLLPDELKNENPLHIWRVVDGERIK